MIINGWVVIFEMGASWVGGNSYGCGEGVICYRFSKNYTLISQLLLSYSDSCRYIGCDYVILRQESTFSWIISFADFIFLPHESSNGSIMQFGRRSWMRRKAWSLLESRIRKLLVFTRKNEPRISSEPYKKESSHWSKLTALVQRT